MNDAEEHLMTVFSAALERGSAAERQAYLDRACADDPALRQRVEALLRAHDRAGGFLGRVPDPAETAGAEPSKGTGPTADFAASAVIAGRYTLRQEIGEGGMGSVFLAEQTQPVKRHVALKLIKPGLDSRTVLARFETERQALALMDHPNIARVLDAGATDLGRPFFVMELVKGIPLTDYCDQHRLGLPERLALFRQICSAVQHAHQKGIIHRDLKPTNILVESHDGHPVPKVIDFGLAKATSGLQLSEHSLFTAFGTVAGTPLYMAPEQAAFNALDVDTRTDIYALGVILYELLTGSTPIRRETFQRAALDEILRVIREVEPPTPSSRISTSEALPAIAATRQIEPARLGRFVRGDLDWIVMKALAKERPRRYESAIALAQDIERFTNHEPVSAGPPTASYRLRKFVRRNRPQVVAAVLGLLALVALLAGLARQQKLKAEKAQTELLLKAEGVAHRETEKARQAAETARQAAEMARAAEQEQRKKAETYLYYNKIVLAEREWTAGNIDRVKELLQQCPQNARGWEWRYLDQMCRRELAVVQGPDEVIYSSMAFSPDGKWVVSGGDSESVRFWDSTSGKVTHELGEKFWSDLLAVSPDARLVVSVGWYPWTPTQTVKLWDAATGKEIQELKRTNLADMRKGVATFSPDGQWLALAIVEDRSVKPVSVTLWDVRARPLKRVHTLKTAARRPVHLAFSPDSRRLAYVAITPELGVRVRELKTWKTETGEALLSVEDLPFVPGEVVFSPDGKQLALTADDRAVHVLDAETGKERRALRADSASPRDVAYRPDGKLIASCGLDGIVQLWDPVRLQCVRTLRGGTGGLADLAFSADGRRLMTCSFQNRMAVWDPDTGQDPLTLQVKGSPLWVAVSPDGGRLACGTSTGRVSIWDPTTGQLLLTLHGHDDKVLGLAFSPDGSLLASGDESHRAVKLWDPTTGQLRRTLTDEGPVYRMTFSPDGQYLATCFMLPNMQKELSEKVNLWSVSAGQRVRTLPGHTNRILDVAFSPDGARLVSASADHTARVWDVKTGREMVCFRGHGQRVYEAKFSPDGRRIASASADKTVNVWDADTGAVIHTLRGHNDRTYSVAFSRDGHRIASGSADGTIKVWDATSGDERLTLRNPGVGVALQNVVFGPEDQWLASSSSGDQTIRLWEATPLTPERRLQRDAATLVNDLPAGLGFKGEMLAYLRTLPSVSEPLREHALSMAERLQEDPWRLNRASYLAVRQPGRDAATYRLALRQAEAARDLAHPGFYFNTYCPATTSIGIAHYRLGEYREAVEALSASEAYYHTAASSEYAPGTPWTLAFLVMAHHRLGEQETAQAILAQLHKVMKDKSEWAADGELQAYVREAEELSWWGSPALTEEERRLRHEAATVVNDLPDALGFKDEILAYLRTLDSLSEPVRQHALTIAERLPEDPWRLHRAALHYQAARKFDRALPLFEESLALRKARLGPDHPDTLISMKYLATAYRALGMHDRDLSLCRELADLWKRKAGADSSQYLGFLAALSVPLLQLEEWTEAETVLRKVLTDSETKTPGAWQTFNLKAMLGGALLGQQRYAAAEPLLRAGYEGMKLRAGTIPQQYKIRLAEALDRLIALAEATNRPEDVRMWKDEKTKLSRDTAPKPDAENP